MPPSVQTPRRRPSAAARLLKWAQRFTIAGGTVALLWCAWVLSDRAAMQRVGREMLESTRSASGRERARGADPLLSAPATVPPAIPSDATPPSPAPEASGPAPSGAASPTLPVRPEPARGTPLAELTLERLGLSAVVLHGTDDRTLELGLGHIEHTPLPGEGGNVAIAGHRDSFFRPLRNVKVGDEIVLKTPEHQIHYKVSSFKVVNPYDVQVIAPTREAALTLVTCYPFRFFGHAPDRFVVRATRVDDSRTDAEAGVPAPDAPSRAPDAPSPPTTPESPLVDAAITSRSEPGSDHSSGLASADSPPDPEADVRAAVERFRLMYNAGLARHAERAQRMAFESCTVTIAGSGATAVCAPERPHDAWAPEWTFKLRETGEIWTVKGVSTTTRRTAAASKAAVSASRPENRFR